MTYMAMGMGIQQQQQMKASPALITLNAMLVLSTAELQQMVQRELEENPALEQIDSVDSACHSCGRPLILWLQVLTPDVVITADDDSFAIEVVESRRFALRLDPFYQELARAAKMQVSADVSSSDHEHVTTFVSRARLFLTNMHIRRDTIRRISECLVVRQEAFLRHGIRFLAPLTRAEVAAEIGVHESTVSRATANKYVQLPDRTIVPFSHFFKASLSVKDILRELVASEQKPLTDEQIVNQLRDQGYDLARRTVAKYRGQLGILPANMR